MSTIDQQFDITPTTGMDLRSTDRSTGSPHLQNVIPRNGEFWVRPGFGLVMEYGTTLNAGRFVFPPDATVYGIGKCIGATTVRTVWGTDQIIAVHNVSAFTGDMKGDDQGRDLYGRRAQYIMGVSVTVYDCNTGRHLEFVLHQQDTQDDVLPLVYPNYATRYNEDHSRWLQPSREPQFALFAVMQNEAPSRGVVQANLVISIDGCGQWTYRPVDFTGPIDRHAQSIDSRVMFPFRGETCAMSPLALGPGLALAVDGVVYLDQQDLGNPTSMTLYNGDRLVYGVRNALRFTDPFLPQAMQALNSYALPTPDAIHMTAPTRNALLVATGRATWLYQPSLGADQADAQLTQISTANGCVNPRAWCVGGDSVYFASDSGVFAYSGGMELVQLSKPIDRLWTDPQSMALPLTDFYQKQGLTSMADVQLPARIDIREQMRNARLTWKNDIDTLFCVCDDVTLCWTSGFGWSVWLYQTHAGDARQVKGAANIASPVLVPLGLDLYLIGGPDTETYVESDDAELHDSSCYLLKMGRGGATDRSMCADAATHDTWLLTLDGYIPPPSTIRANINGVNRVAFIMDGMDFADAYAAQAAAINSLDPHYDAVVVSSGVVLVAKVPGAVGAFPVFTTIGTAGTGTYTATHLIVGTNADVTDAPLEDRREPVGGWLKMDPGGGLGTGFAPAFYIDKPIVLPPGFTAPGAGSASTVDTFWFPVRLGNTAASAYRLHFGFDSTKWRPICVSASPIDPDYAEMAFVLPCERLGSEAGYLRGTPDATHQVRVYDSATGTLNPFGDEIRIDFDGTGGAWTSAPYLNISAAGPDTLLYLGFRFIGASASALWLGTSFTANTDAQVDELLVTSDCFVYVWQAGRYPEQYAALAAKQQPVDWVVKSRELEDGGNQLRCRGVGLTVMHLGDGTNDTVPAWRYGPLNTATSSDWRDYSAQYIDFYSTPPGNSAQNDIDVLPRMGVGTGNLTANVFGGQATWGDIADPAAGNLLVADPAVDTLQTTDGSQGARLSVMVHGCMNAPGDSVRLGRIMATLKRMGLVRRWR